MREVVVVGEGQTKETFVRDVLVAAMADRQIFLPRLIRTSRAERGGALTWERVRRFLRRMLLERRDTYITTFFDLYGLPSDFPGVMGAAAVHDPLERARAVERAFRAAIVVEAGCREDRFLPHIQPYEFESLLFTDISVLPQLQPEWTTHLEPLIHARQVVPSPEHVNDGATPHPSAPLTATLVPRYEKVLYGAAAVGRIGLDLVRAECAHFGAWLDRLDSLPDLRPEA